MPVLSSVVTLLAAVGVLLVTAVSAYTLVVDTIGIVLLVISVVRGSSRIFTIGIAMLFGGIVIAGMLGVAPVFLLLAAFLGAIVWEVGQNGFSITREVGHGVPTLRIELVHLVSSVVVLVAGVSIGYAVFLTAMGGQPAIALIALLVGVVALLIAL
jgi:hypothetical protein